MAANDGTKLYKVGSSRIRKCKVKLNKYKRNRNKKLRRKRSKLQYTENLQTLKHRKQSQELCETLSVFNITDMKCGDQGEYYLKAPQDVTEWQYQHQLAYWKSRAVSLEYENRMLHAHIKKMCSQEIQNYIDYVKQPDDANPTACIDAQSSVDYETTETSDVDIQLPPVKNEVLQEDVKSLYGEMQSKINGMEAAMTVNYNMKLDKLKPPMWPNIPLNL